MYLVVGSALVVVTFAGLGVAVYLRRQFDRSVSNARDDLFHASDLSASRRAPHAYRPEDVADTPPPVRRYFHRVLSPGKRPIHSVKIEQEGTFRLGGTDARWSFFTATQAVCTDLVGFVWDAYIRLLPGIFVRAVDAYVEGEGRLDARLISLLPVVHAGPSSEMNEGELLRFLAEAPLYPTVLLPGKGRHLDVRWGAGGPCHTPRWRN